MRLWELIGESSYRERYVSPARSGWTGSVAFSPDGEYLAAGRQGETAPRLWRLSGAGSEVMAMPVITPTSANYVITSVGFDAQSRWLVATDAASKITIYKTETGAQAAQVDAFSGIQWSASFSTDGATLAHTAGQ